MNKPLAIKFGVCVVVGLIGFQMVMARASIAQIIIGFLLVSVAVVFGTVYLIRLRQPKNPMEDEIQILLRRAQDQEKEKNKKQ
jgi:hypothetical protein